MARLDSLARAPWADGALLAGVLADGTTLALAQNLTEGVYLVGATGSCDIAWVYDLQQLDSTGAVKHTQRRRAAAGNEDFVFPSAIFTKTDDQILLILRGGITVVGLQMSVFLQAPQ